MIGFNGTGLMLQPTTAGWSEQDSIGTNGFGHNIYPRLREFHMEFNLTSQGEFYELLSYFRQVGMTGTLSASLPCVDCNTFSYQTYSGVVLQQPSAQEYFAEEYSSQVKLILLVPTS